MLTLTTCTAGHVFASEQFPAPGNISPQAQAYLNKVKTGELPHRGEITDPKMLTTLRGALGKMFLRNATEIEPDFYLTEQHMGSVAGYWVNRPAPAKPGRVIVYLHGGGYILGSAQQNVGSALRVTRAADVPVLSVEYRLAPEHPFPAGLDDALQAYRWLLDTGYEAADIAIYGDSAGGGLTLALVLAARDRGWPLPAGVAVLSPLADITPQGDTRITLISADPILRSLVGGTYGHYAGDEPQANPLLSPIYADYTGFPPMLLQVGTREQLLSDSVRLARSARAAGVKVEFDVWDGMWHGWHDTPGLAEAEQACGRLAAFFLAHFDAAT
jgi:monoterpene epsilon-lactone hydrolase